MLAIGLVRPKTKANVGAVLRAGDVATNPTDTMKAYRRVPTICSKDVFDGHPVSSIPIGVDLVAGAQSLFDFIHPKRAFYIFGPEDGTLGKHHLDRCAHRVFIPTIGCMNLAATVNVVLYDRARKAAQ